MENICLGKFLISNKKVFSSPRGISMKGLTSCSIPKSFDNQILDVDRCCVLAKSVILGRNDKDKSSF